MTILRSAFVLLLMLAHRTPAQTSESVRSVEALDLAYQLAEYGRVTRSALPLLAAVEIVLNNAPRPLNDTTTVRGWFDAMELLADAERFSVNDEMKTLVTLLRGRASGGMRGSASGPRSASYVVGAGATQTLLLAFVPGSPAAVRVRAAGGRRIECRVTGGDGRTLATDRGTASCFLNFTPVRPAPVRIVVRNATTAQSSLIVITN